MKKIYLVLLVAIAAFAISMQVNGQTTCCPPTGLVASAVGGGNIVFCWNSPTGTFCSMPTKYKVKVHVCGTPGGITYTFNPNVGLNCQTITGFTPGTSYCWKVRTRCSNATGIFYSTWVNGPSVIATEPRELNAVVNRELQVFPNPASNKISVMGASDANGNIQFDVYNIMGQLMHSESQAMNVGAWMKDMDVSSLPSGSYVIKITSVSGASSITFVKE